MSVEGQSFGSRENELDMFDETETNEIEIVLDLARQERNKKLRECKETRLYYKQIFGGDQ